MRLNVWLALAVVLAVAVVFMDADDVQTLVNEELHNALSDVAPRASKECLGLAVATMQGRWYATDAETANCARDAINKLTLGE